eukprot:11797081-Alexandrium_andersonii.AAC.1
MSKEASASGPPSPVHGGVLHRKFSRLWSNMRRSRIRGGPPSCTPGRQKSSDASSGMPRQ